MQIVLGLLSLVIIVIILRDAFETIILPRRVSRKLRLTRQFYAITWTGWATIARWIRSSERRDYYLSYYGPLSLILLLAVWAIGLVFGFALLQWSFGSMFNAPEKNVTFGTDLYVSGTTFFTLGLGDVTPGSWLARLLMVIEAGMGFGFL